MNKMDSSEVTPMDVVVISSDDESPQQKPHKSKTLSELAEERCLDSLSAAVEGYQSTANYCCGGSLPITIPSIAQPLYVSSKKLDPNKTQNTIALRWDVSQDQGSARKVEFPLVHSDSQILAQTMFEELLKTCAPATFGRNNEDILDESYRKAGKLDREQFSINFHPHDYGIVDAIAQTLLPQIDGAFLKERVEHRGLLAELYKVNIYSGPSGKFRGHVDTPRGPTQFGSLVVCLPHPHEGGQLRVSHKGHSSFFDWSNTDSHDIQWAAFYSDCEHEVFEVKSGHRITLTYNLYITEQVGGVLRRNPTIDPSLFPLYEGAKQMLSQPNFMNKGGNLGFYCAYKYAHHSSRAHALMSWALKGVDVAIYSVFSSLGLDVRVGPILENNRQLENLEEQQVDEYYASADYDSDSPDYERKIRVGATFHKVVLDADGGYDIAYDKVEKNLHKIWPHDEYKDVTWLNTAREEEVAMVSIAYGNEAELDWCYSHAAILVTVPAHKDRDHEAKKNMEAPAVPSLIDVATF
ncbi:uncharacterized protein LY89DRAFT_784308 [Mollisia scopiformis]|uniref:Fe2OG dioxygenase domain-containing protein n=1 Tax=Mollisia scopiformis TaxID=149040 RepID=A0A194X2E7_MOLSC|nr:uncharacterized protein LY89DRAFT_784308 [Mollisia scopiformis]KUJ14348.1 hypothetical protein LY89DRAFT_784308 [Mollisia scopiformis]